MSKVFGTITEVVNYLVSGGMHAGVARAMVLEYLTYDNADDNDLLQREGADGKAEAFTMKRDEIAEFKWDVQDEFEVTDEGIEFDGELMFDLQGNYL